MIRQARTNTRTRHTDLIEAVQEEHQAIFDAIKTSDADAAARATQRFLAMCQAVRNGPAEG